MHRAGKTRGKRGVYKVCARVGGAAIANERTSSAFPDTFLIGAACLRDLANGKLGECSAEKEKLPFYKPLLVTTPTKARGLYHRVDFTFLLFNSFLLSIFFSLLVLIMAAISIRGSVTFCK